MCCVVLGYDNDTIRARILGIMHHGERCDALMTGALRHDDALYARVRRRAYMYVPTRYLATSSYVGT